MQHLLGTACAASEVSLQEVLGLTGSPLKPNPPLWAGGARVGVGVGEEPHPHMQGTWRSNGEDQLITLPWVLRLRHRTLKRTTRGGRRKKHTGKCNMLSPCSPP